MLQSTTGGDVADDGGDDNGDAVDADDGDAVDSTTRAERRPAAIDADDDNEISDNSNLAPFLL